MILSEYIKKERPIDKAKADDILAQLLGYICRNTDPLPGELLYLDQHNAGGLRINPDNIEVKKDDKNSGYVDLEMQKKAETDDYSVLLRESGMLCCSEEKDNVLAAAVIYTELLYGEEFYYDSSSVSEVEDDLLKEMLEPNPNKRITALEALKMLASRYINGGERCWVILNYIEAETGMRIKSESRELDMAVGCPKTESEITNDKDQTHFTVISASKKRIYFRVAPITVDVLCTRKKRPRNFTQPSFTGKIRVGLDFGFHKVNVSCIDSSGKLCDVFSSNFVSQAAVYPFAAACLNGELKFGSAAVQLYKESGTELKYIVDICDNAGQIAFELPNGTSIMFDSTTVLRKFLNALKSDILKSLIICESDVSFAYSLSFSSEEIKRERFREALKECGFGSNELSSGQAIACSLIHENNMQAQDSAFMVIDAGAGAVHIEVFKYKGNNSYESLYVKNAPGGYAVTQKLYNSTRYDVEYAINNGVLNSKRDSAAIYETMDSLKKALNYSYENNESVQRKIPIVGNQNDAQYVGIGSKSKVLKTSAAGIYKAITGAVKDCVNHCLDNHIRISYAIVCGGVIAVSDLNKNITELLRRLSGCKVVFIEHDQAAARGTAFFAGVERRIEKKTETRSDSSVQQVQKNDVALNATIKEYGIQIKASRNELVFKSMIPIGTKYENDCVKFDMPYKYEVNRDEIERGSCVLFLYTRQAGKQHVRSTLDANNNGAIAAIAKVSFSLPIGFKADKDHFTVDISVDRQDRIKPDIRWKRNRFWGVGDQGSLETQVKYMN